MDESKIIAEGKIDLGRVYLEIEGETPAPVLEDKSVTITTNTDTLVEPSEGYDGMSTVTVTTNVQPTLETVEKTILENGEMSIEPSVGYDGISSVSLTVDVPQGFDWSTLGFDSEPYVNDVIIEDANYLKQNWNVSGSIYSQYDYNSGEYRSKSCFPYIDTSSVTNLSFYNCSYLIAVADNLDWSRQTSFNNTFNSCRLFNAPKITFNSIITSCQDMFRYNQYMRKVPIYDLSHITNASNMFGSCSMLDDESLDNILQSLITGVNIPTKTLNYIGINNTYSYPVNRIEALPHYNDFINAGWTIGY